MQHKFLSVFTVVLFAVLVMPCYSADRPALLSQDELNHYGLERAWYSQIIIDGRITSIDHLLLDRGTFFLVTGNNGFMALDADTGKTLWTRHINNNGLKSYSPAANKRTVALVSGNEVHVFDRRNGRLLWHEVLPSTPSAACQLTDSYLYVPLIDQRMVCYPMEELKAPSPGLLELVPQYDATSNRIATTEEMVTSMKGEKKPAPSKRLLGLVPQYAKLGMVLNPYTGEVTEAGRSVATWWQENLIAANEPLKGKMELDELLAEELQQERKRERQERTDQRVDDDALDIDDPNTPYYLKRQKNTPMVCYSFGTTLVQPIISYDSHDIEALTWFSDRGYLFIAHASHDMDKGKTFALQYQIAVMPVLSYMKETKIGRFTGSIARDIVFQPAVVQKNPDVVSSRFMIIVGSASGMVFAYDPKTSESRWWQTVGSPIANRITVVKDKIYIPCLDGNLCCLDSQQGDLLWRSPGIDSFIAASPGWVYAKNTSGELVAVNPNDGAQMTLFSLKAYKDVFYNNENDRLYLIASTGLIQCLHELGREEPVRHTWLSDAYRDYKESEEERRKLIEMPEIPGGIRQPRQTPQSGSEKRPQTSPGTIPPEDSPFGVGFDSDSLFEDTTVTPVTPATSNTGSQADDTEADFGFSEFESFDDF